jgi:transposase
MRTVGGSDCLMFRRFLAVRHVVEGDSTQEVADYLQVDPRSVRRWLAAYRQDGVDGLEARPVSGRPPKLTTTQEKIIRRWLSEDASGHGFTTDLWSTPRLAWLMETEFGVRFHPNYLCTWLRQRNYTPQKPRRVPREQDEAVIARWLAEDWPRIKHKAGRHGACLLLLDESGLLMAPLLRRSWALRGHPSESKYKARHREKVSVAAALWLPPKRDQLHMAYQTLVNGYFTNVEVAEFLGCAVRVLPGPVIAIWDGGRMHQGGPIQALVEESHGRLDLEPLPPYASELMPVEYLWRWLKHGRLNNFTPYDASQLNEAITCELDAVRDNQTLLTSFFHQSRLPLPRTLLS